MTSSLPLMAKLALAAVWLVSMVWFPFSLFITMEANKELNSGIPPNSLPPLQKRGHDRPYQQLQPWRHPSPNPFLRRDLRSCASPSWRFCLVRPFLSFSHSTTTSSSTNTPSEREHDCWIWHYESAALYFDNQETVRFRVEDEAWHDQAPTKPESEDNEAGGKVSTNPYQILGAMEEMGLGPCLWWDGEEGEEAVWIGMEEEDVSIEGWEKLLHCWSSERVYLRRV